jgi:hypothetical protein
MQVENSLSLSLFVLIFIKVIPVWSSEVSPHQARGGFLAIEFFLNISGLSLAYWIEMSVHFKHTIVN